MARPQTVTDEEILEAALECLLEQGPSVSTDVIAARLGVSSQALLKRFQSRQKLVMAALRPPERSPWHNLVEAGPDDRPFDQQLQEVAEAVAEFFVGITRRMEVMRWSGISPREMLKTYPEPPPLFDIRVLAAWFDRAAAKGMIRHGDHRATAMTLLSSLHTPAMLEEIMGFHPLQDREESFLQELAHLLTAGLQPAAAEAVNASAATVVHPD